MSSEKRQDHYGPEKLGEVSWWRRDTNRLLALVRFGMIEKRKVRAEGLR